MLLIPVVLLSAQEAVTARGAGLDRQSAIRDALRQAVAQVVGTRLESWTKVKDFQAIEDAILTQTEGYIQSHEVVSESISKDKQDFVVHVRAVVGLSPLEQDSKSLAQWLGGLRFMVVYDPRKVQTAQDSFRFGYAYERMNEYLARHGYRYVERDVFDRLKGEAVKLVGADTSTISYARKLAFLADAEFFISIHNIIIRAEPKALGITSYKGTADAKSYDNCTSEGLGSVVGEGDWVLQKEATEGERKALDAAVYNAAEKNLYLITQYLGTWVNTGAPFELRFYGAGYKVIRQLKDKLIADPDFGGQREIVAAPNYVKLGGITFKKPADEMVDKILDYAGAIPELAKLDLALLYGRQASFALPGIAVPEAGEKAKVGAGPGQQK
jgi:hypothetical protein